MRHISSGSKLNEMEASNLPETEFKTLVIRMLNELMERIDEHNESIKKGHRNHKKESDRNEEHENGNEEYIRRIQQ